LSTIPSLTSGATVMPADGTIPQQTEGDQFATLAITPTATVNRLIVEGKLNITGSVS